MRSSNDLTQFMRWIPGGLGSVGLGLAIMLGLVVPLRPALATDTPVRGAKLVGQYFRAECPPGSYLVGFSGRTGAWIDHIAPVCARLAPNARTLGDAFVAQAVGTSSGGSPGQVQCPNATVIRVTRHSMTIGDDGRVKYVESISADCFTTTGSYNTHRTFGRPTNLPIIDLTSKPLDDLSQCPAGEFARGFHGRAGTFLNAFGLICGPLVPAKPGTAPPAQAKNMPSALPTAPTINSPTANGLLVKGKGSFRITPSPYLTGTHAVYQLRWINPPAIIKQQGGDFYTQEVAMALLGSPTGLPAPQTLLAQGTWEIRVRITQPKVSDWSDWVRFEYLLQDPMRQTVPQALAPGIGGTTLIRPRGTDASDATDGDAPSKESQP